MILIVAEAHDEAAIWLRRRLADRSSKPVRLVTPIRLLCGRSLIQRLDSDGGDFVFAPVEGAPVRGEELDGVINRLAAMPTAQLGAGREERRYAEDELYAFLLGWLASLRCPILNPPSPAWLAGASHGPLAMRHFAALAGLHCDPVRLTPDAPEPGPPCGSPPGASPNTHFVLDEQLIGPVVEARARARLLHFARLWGARLVQIETCADAGVHRFVAASSFVDFPRGGQALVRAVAEAFGR